MICENCGKEIESYIGTPEFSKRVGLSKETIRKHIEAGDIQASQYMGNRYVIPESEVAKFKAKFLKPAGNRL